MHRILRHIELLREKVPDWKAYPFSIPAIAGLTRLEFHPKVTYFIGENGSGKSTLLEAVAIKARFPPEGGSKGFLSRHRPSESPLHEYLKLVRGAVHEKGGFFLRAETMFNVSTEVEAGEYDIYYGWDRLHDKSHGEAFLWVANNRFRPQGLYVLDEPEAAFSPQRQLAFLARMHQLVRGKAQFVISTHSPILMAYPDATIYLLDSGGIRPIAYEETDHYLVTKAFLQDPAGQVRKLFDGIPE
jgi:predicted ATPase